MLQKDKYKFRAKLLDLAFEKAFTFTDSSVAFDGFFKGNVRVTAKTKSGVKVDSFSATGGESEVLFKPDTKFKITKKELMSDGKTWDIELEEMD